MRVAFLATNPEWTGAARAFAVAARAFAAAGDTVRFFVTPDSRAQEHVSGDAYETTPLSTEGALLGPVMRVRSALRQYKADVVFVHTQREHVLAALAYALGSRAAIVRRTPPGERLDLAWPTRFAARIAPTAFLFTGEHDARTALVPANLGAVVVGELGVNLPAADEPGDTGADGERDPYHVLCLFDGLSRGRTALPVRTVALLAPRHPEIRLSIVGHGSDGEDVRMHVAALDVLPRVALLGERDDVGELMKSATFGWVASTGDDAAFAMLDLMAAGLPVIASDDGIARRYVADGITGLVVRADDATLAAGALAGVIGRDEQVAAMAEAARARVAREFPETKLLEGFDRAARAARDGARRKG